MRWLWLCTGMRRVILLSSFIIDYLLAVNISFVSTHNITWALNERNIQIENVKMYTHKNKIIQTETKMFKHENKQ